MSNPEDRNAKHPFPIQPESWGAANSPGLTGVKKSPRLERRGKVRLPDQPGQAIDLTEPGIIDALDAADATEGGAKPPHTGHRRADESTGH